MSGHLIEFRCHPHSQWEEWGNYKGTRNQARQSAEKLLESLREEEGHAKAAVRVDGQQICIEIPDWMR